MLHDVFGVDSREDDVPTAPYERSCGYIGDDALVEIWSIVLTIKCSYKKFSLEPHNMSRESTLCFLQGCVQG